MILYLDTAALLKLYVQETGFREVREAVSRATTVAASRLNEAADRESMAVL